jgi:hypothetical protein
MNTGEFQKNQEEKRKTGYGERGRGSSKKLLTGILCEI